MWHLLFEILAALNIVVAVIVIVGFWTYADYITNVDTNYKVIYGIVECVSLVVSLEVYGLTSAFDNGVIVLGIITFVSLIISCICLVLHGFVKSRQYFGRKRNKV